MEPRDVENASSPLWMVSQAPALNELVLALRAARGELESGTGGRLVFSRTKLSQARAEFTAMIRRGERDLHALAGLLSQQLLGTFGLRSSAIGEVEHTHERFTITVDVTEDELARSTDLDLGTRILARLAIADQRGWRRATLVSNVVEYEPTGPTRATSTACSPASRPKKKSGTRWSTNSSTSTASSCATNNCST